MTLPHPNPLIYMNGYNPVLIVLLACCLLIIPFKMLSAQNKQSDLALLQAVKPGQPYNPTPNPNNKKTLQVKSPSAFAKYNPLSQHVSLSKCFVGTIGAAVFV